MNKWLWLLSIWLLVPCCGCSDSAEPSVDISTLNYISGLEANRIVWHWENRFSRKEVIQIKAWLKEIDFAVIQTLGNYAFEIHYYIHRSTRGNEPVPWAHTTRKDIQGVHFHVNMDFDLDDFLTDWTAQHEISHLAIPFVGSKNAWFSEGYATFMQYKIMQKQGVYTSDQVHEKFQTRIEECKESYQSDKPLPIVADSLKQKWEYPDMYWGGFTFFYMLDEQLNRSKNMELSLLIEQYGNCCRINDSTPSDLCTTLDSISGSNLASQLLDRYMTVPARDIFKDIEKMQ
jgi:hypothetical protein